GAEAGADVLARWETVLDALATDRGRVAHWVDWVAKERLITGYAERHGVAPGDARLKALDLQYHDMRPDKGLAARMQLETIADPDDVAHAMSNPPTTTRAYFRGRCLRKWPDEIVAANWDSMVFDIGDDPLRRVPMEPLRGSAAHVGALLNECDTAAELLARLGS
ncbi:MAG TPA: proteasome accessory factor PafA2 family protein, partial [Ilumatobacteraceae bacterium]|nr:proteasome accessory factor PafA2 family protein [Ilumatobacteraceae bacterium]